VSPELDLLSSTMNTSFLYHSRLVNSPKRRHIWTCRAAVWTFSSSHTPASILGPR
jgi:hypothetical protein